MRPTIESPHTRRYTVSGERLASGRSMAIRTRGWMESNPSAFFEIVGYVKAMQGRRCGRVRDRVAAFCVDRGIDVGGEYAFDNTLWAGISRYAALFDPSLVGDPLRFRDSDTDCYGLLPVSYLPDLKPGEKPDER